MEDKAATKEAKRAALAQEKLERDLKAQSQVVWKIHDEIKKYLTLSEVRCDETCIPPSFSFPACVYTLGAILVRKVAPSSESFKMDVHKKKDAAAEVLSSSCAVDFICCFFFSRKFD